MDALTEALSAYNKPLHAIGYATALSIVVKAGVHIYNTCKGIVEKAYHSPPSGPVPSGKARPYRRPRGGQQRHLTEAPAGLAAGTDAGNGASLEETGIPIVAELGFNAGTDSLLLRNFVPQDPARMEELRAFAKKGVYMKMHGTAIPPNMSLGNHPADGRS